MLRQHAREGGDVGRAARLDHGVNLPGFQPRGVQRVNQHLLDLHLVGADVVLELGARVQFPQVNLAVLQADDCRALR